MKLKHKRYKEVTVICKGKPVIFTGGIAILTDKTLVKELLKNPYIEEIKEESDPEPLEEPKEKPEKETDKEVKK